MADADVPTLLAELYPSLHTLAIAAVSGAVGGSAHPFFDSGGDRERSNASLAGLFLASCWIGVVGALAFLFIEVSLGAIQLPLKELQALRLCSLSVIAGFGARKFIPMITDHLSRQVAEHEKLLNEARAQIKTQQDQNERISSEIAQLEAFKAQTEAEGQLANVVNGDAAVSDYPGLMDRIKHLVSRGKARTALVIWYAMQLKREGDVAGAIQVLEAALRAPQEGNINQSRMHYNLACYYSLLASKTTSPEHERKSADHLSSAIRSDSDRRVLLNAARTDEDLEWLRSRTEYGRTLFGAREGDPT